MERSPAIDARITDVLKEIFSLVEIIIRGTAIEIPVRKFKIILTRTEITRNDQKFFAEAPKNSEEEIPLLFLLKPVNNPPARKIFIIKPAIISSRNPAEK